VERVSHLSRVSGESGQNGDLAIGGDAPAGNPPDDVVDAGIP
jgi:hypothetical protein